MIDLPLKENFVYETKEGDLIVLIGSNSDGKELFQPVGEPSFQDRFMYNDSALTHLVREVRRATHEDLGY